MQKIQQLTELMRFGVLLIERCELPLSSELSAVRVMPKNVLTSKLQVHNLVAENTGDKVYRDDESTEQECEKEMLTMGERAAIDTLGLPR